MANVKLSQIVASGSNPVSGDFLIGVLLGNTTDSRITFTQATQALTLFTSTLQGVVPSSGGGTTNFLRADGTWAVPPGGGGGAVTSVSNSDGTLTISPTTGAVVASIALGHANTWSAAQTFNSSDFILAGSTSGTTVVNATATASGTLTLPAATDTLVARATTDTLTNKTITSSTNVLGGVTATFGSDATGDIYYRNSSGILTRLGIGATGNVLSVSGGLPAWTSAGSGTVTGTGTSGQVTFWNGTSSITGDTGLTYAGSGGALTLNTNSILTTPAAATWQFGAADAAAPVAQTMQVQSVVGGTANIAGQNWLQQASRSTGGGVSGNINVATGFTGTGAAATATISNASPAVITEAAHNYFIGEPFTLTTTGTLPTGFSTLTTYYIISAGFGAGAFEASTSFGGSAVNTSSAGSGTHTVNPGGVCTISNASPAVVTLNNHGLVPGMQVQFATTGSLPTGLSTATNYFVISAGLTVNAFEVSATLNGTAINTSSAGSGTQTVLYQGGTLQNPAYTVATWGPSQLTASQTTPALQINPTWNTQGVASALKMNVTSAAFAAGSRLIDLQINGATQFFVNPVGNGNAIGLGVANFNSADFAWFVYSNGGAAIGQGAAGANPTTFTAAIQATDTTLSGTPPSLKTSAGGAIGWASSGQAANGGDTAMFRDSAGIVAIRNGTNASSLRVYNTSDNAVPGVNYERGVFDWTTTANVLTIGTQAGGTGSTRGIKFVYGTTTVFDVGVTYANGTNITIPNGTNISTPSVAPLLNFDGTQVNIATNNAVPVFIGATNSTTIRVRFPPNIVFSNGTEDCGLSRVAAKVLSFQDGTLNNAAGWMQWAGQTRVTSDVTFTSTTTLSTVTGLSTNVQAGRTYCFEAQLQFTDAAAGGIQAAISGTATATNIIYSGWTVDSAANGIKGNTQATALGTAVASTTTTGTAGMVQIYGTITVNAAGTLLVQAAQNTSNATATTIKRGSYFYVYDNA